ncbi:MAG: phosphoribosylaminoimidazolesuccinocarboxamide synthase [Candidatus Aenigmarchaeota archaeon]|nr:phosphoribosylaminoimidazolesuccinocarboxamide synthase [Candidatus Aenigmarchaeota archaeon]
MNGLPLVKQGKVRNVYDAGDGKLVLESTDRLSAFDIVLADTIPYKGEVLNGLSAHHLQMTQTGGIHTHYIRKSDDRGMLVYKLDMIPVEIIVRSYLYGSAWDRYGRGEFDLPKGTEPRKGAKFPYTVVEFTTKLEASDRPIDTDEILRNGWMTRAELGHVIEIAKYVHDIVAEGAARDGILLADEKMEFGRNPELANVPILGDELGTPDSARFWDALLYAENFEAGRDQPSYDKQFVRDHLLHERGWDKQRPAPGTRLTEPLLTREVVAKTSEKYLEARERIIGGYNSIGAVLR